MTLLRTLLVAHALMLVAMATPTSAATIDLRLDVNYAGGLPSAGGTWQLFARADGFGLFSLTVPISGVNSSVNVEGPVGRVNGSATDNAGFSTYAPRNLGSTQELTFAQLIIGDGAGQQGVFYGVGTLANGSPNFPGQQGGTNDLGPNLTTLTNVQGVPWANDDPLWSTGVTMASGTFSANATPAFSETLGSLDGRVITDIGLINSPPSFEAATSITTLVTTNLAFGVATGDYNADGLVDAADYTVWRDALGQTVTPLTGADGNGDGEINTADRAIWATNYGLAPTATATAVPEPAGVVSIAMATLAFAAVRRTSPLRGGAGKTEQTTGIA